jgi:hypothetical protein
MGKRTGKIVYRGSSNDEAQRIVHLDKIGIFCYKSNNIYRKAVHPPFDW